MAFFTEIEKNYLKVHVELQVTQITIAILSKKKT